MPELPEVEVTRRQLEPLLVGRRVARVYTTVPSYFFLTPPAELRRRLPGRRFELLERIGKYLLARLDNGDRLLLHLGMTGQIFGSGIASVRLLSSAAGASLTPEAQLEAFRPDKHTHLRLRFDDGGPEVFFRDARKFGKVQLMRPGAPSERLDRLGPDALGASGKRLVESLRGRKAPIKALLLDQALLAGVRPTRPGRRVTREESDRIARAVRRVLRRSITTGGSSISDYVQPDGNAGAYQDERRVYGREGEPCPSCGARIRRIVIGQRSAHYCPRCQT